MIISKFLERLSNFAYWKCGLVTLTLTAVFFKVDVNFCNRNTSCIGIQSEKVSRNLNVKLDVYAPLHYTVLKSLTISYNVSNKIDRSRVKTALHNVTVSGYNVCRLINTLNACLDVSNCTLHDNSVLGLGDSHALLRYLRYTVIC